MGGCFFGVLLINTLILRMKSTEWNCLGILNHIEICTRMLLMSSGVTLLINTIIKMIVGRPRPNFYALMESGNASMQRAARRSFPSGHSAYSISMLYLVSLNLYAAVKYVQGQLIKGRRIRVSMFNPHSFFFGHDFRFI